MELASFIILSRGQYPTLQCSYRQLILIQSTEWHAVSPTRRTCAIIRHFDGTQHSRGVGVPWGLARWKSSHCNPLVSQSVNQILDWVTADRSRDRNADMVMLSQWEHGPSTNTISACTWPRHVRQRLWPSDEDSKWLHPETQGQKNIFKRHSLPVLDLLGNLGKRSY